MDEVRGGIFIRFAKVLVRCLCFHFSPHVVHAVSENHFKLGTWAVTINETDGEWEEPYQEECSGCSSPHPWLKILICCNLRHQSDSDRLNIALAVAPHRWPEWQREIPAQLAQAPTDGSTQHPKQPGNRRRSPRYQNIAQG